MLRVSDTVLTGALAGLDSALMGFTQVTKSPLVDL